MTIKSDLAALQTNAGLFASLLAGDETATVTINAVDVPSFAKRVQDAADAAVAPYGSAAAIATAAAASASFAAASAANAAAIVTGGTAEIGGGAGKLPICTSDGNLPLGFVPSVARAGTGKAIDLKYFGYGISVGYGAGFCITENIIIDANGKKYGVHGYAGRLALENGGVKFFTAGSGLPGTAVTDASVFEISASGVVSPGSNDNTTSLGKSSNRWSVIYAGTGTINTSDATEKTAVSTLMPSEINAAKALAQEIGVFQFLDAVAAKGADNARLHIGLTVQRAMEIMEANGLDPFRYAFICRDDWTDDDGTEHTRYGFRYDQLLAFIAAGFHARLEALEAAAWPAA